MPALPSPGQVVKLEYSYTLEDAPATNIFYFRYGGGSAITVAQLEDLDAGLITQLQGCYVPAAIAACVGSELKYTDLSIDTGAEYSVSHMWSGTNMGEALPASVAVCVSDSIARRYRGGHPRTYQMVGSAGDFVSGSVRTWQASFLANLQTAWDDFMGLFPLTVDGMVIQPVNVSYYETVGGVKTVRPTPVVDVIYAKICKERICTQRRRLGRVGG